MPVVKRLPHRLGLILPSRDRSGRPLGRRRQQKIQWQVMRWFRQSLGGDTQERLLVRPRLRGRFVVDSGALVIEKVSEVVAQCTFAGRRRLRSDLVRLAEWICGEADQAAVAILVDQTMELIGGL